jgi:parallel beta-helix repeat protein
MASFTVLARRFFVNAKTTWYQGDFMRLSRFALLLLTCLGALSNHRFTVEAKCLNPDPPRAPAVQGEGKSGGSEKPILLYVSTQGNDSWTGKLVRPNQLRTDGPFATISRALSAVRALKGKGPLGHPVTVYVGGGRYDLSEPIVLTPEDSGTTECPLTIEASEGEVPIISGGETITGWEPVKHGGLRELWRARVPRAKEGNRYFHELFVNGQRRQRARDPNTGYFKVDGTITPDRPASFKFHEGDIQPAWVTKRGVEIVTLLNWAAFRMPVRSVDTTTHTVTLEGRRQHWGNEKGARYWVENAFEALDTPGEWYWDPQAGWVYYCPMAGEDMTRAEVVAPRLDQLVLLRGYDQEWREFVDNIRIRGLVFAYTDWSIPETGYVDMQAAVEIPGAVEGVGVVSCIFQKCLFEHLGGYAIAFERASRDNQIVDNEMTDLGAGGVKVGPTKDFNESDYELTSGNVISGNHIHDIGKVFPGGVAVWIGQSSGNTVSRNHIHNTLVYAISVGWSWGYMPTDARDNIIELNHIHDIGLHTLSDLGCIYTLGVQPGTIIRKNLCHDVTRYERGYGGWGIYLDEGSSNILVENNIVFRTEDGGFHQHYGQGNIVRNNIFALGRRAQIRRTREERHISFTFEHNIVYWTDGDLLDGRWFNNRFDFDSNLYFRTDGLPIRFADFSLQDWQRSGQDVHSIVADPLFEDPESGKFQLKANSPAAKIGFQPIDLSGVPSLK